MNNVNDMNNSAAARDIDWLTVSFYMALVLTGWLMIFAVGYQEGAGLFDLGTRHGSQMIWVAISFLVGMFVMVLDDKFYPTFAYVIYALVLLILIYVLGFGRIVSGSKSWLDLGFFRFQPSEFAKFGTCLALASFLSPFNIHLNQQPRHQWIALGIIGLPMLLVLLQGDAGSALVFLSLTLVLYREGMPLTIYIFGITVALLSIVSLLFDDTYAIIFTLILVATGILSESLRWQRSRLVFGIYAGLLSVAFYFINKGYVWILIGVAFLVALGFLLIRTTGKKRQLSYVVLIALGLSSAYTFCVNYLFYKVLEPHQQDRLLAWLRPEKVDPLGALYNVKWSQRAIGSGGLTGKGFLKGNVTKLNYVPEQATDFIFCTVGEEQGFVGVLAVILLYVLLLFRIVFIAERQRTRFNRVYAYGVASVLFFHLFINVGMTMGLAPVIGIPLPYMSYGGSSLLAFTILLAILVKLDGSRMKAFR